MDTETVVKLAGGIRKLAALLGITTQAVYLWGDKVPPLRMYELRDLKPEWFTTKVELKQQ